VRARDTAWWRRLVPLHGGLWKGLLEDSGAHPELFELGVLAKEHCAAAHVLTDDGRGDEAALQIEQFGGLAAQITLMVVKASPELTHFYGGQLGLAVGRFIEGQVIQGLYGMEAVKAAVAESDPLEWQGLPHTPITFANPPSFAKATQRDLFKLDQVMKSYRPEGRRGRPTGTANDGESRQAWTLKQAGASWLDIAEALWTKRPDPLTDYDAEAVRRRVRARVKRGMELETTN
jgi:hypothetical protein